MIPVVSYVVYCFIFERVHKAIAKFAKTKSKISKILQKCCSDYLCRRHNRRHNATMNQNPVMRPTALPSASVEESAHCGEADGFAVGVELL